MIKAPLLERGSECRASPRNNGLTIALHDGVAVDLSTVLRAQKAHIMLHEEQPIWEAKGKRHNRPDFFIALFIALLLSKTH